MKKLKGLSMKSVYIFIRIRVYFFSQCASFFTKKDPPGLWKDGQGIQLHGF
jgi:hypothetical protein